MYDPISGRMLSPDNYIQSEGFSQSYNRYSYCVNNPLRYTDPSGNSWEGPGGTADPGFTGPVIPNINFSEYFPVNPYTTSTSKNGSIIQSMIEKELIGSTREANFVGPKESENITGKENNNYKLNLYIEGEAPGATFYIGVAGSISENVLFSKTYGTWMGKDFKIRSQDWGGNGNSGGKYKFAEKWSTRMGYVGYGFAVYGAFDINEDYRAGEISTFRMTLDQTMNAIGGFGGIYGAVASFGWEIGRQITYTQSYQESVSDFWFWYWKSCESSVLNSNFIYSSPINK